MQYTIDQIVSKLVEFQGRSVEVIGYRTLSDISQLDGQTHVDPAFTLLFLTGELQHPEVQGGGQIEMVSGVAQLALGGVNIGKVTSGNWVLVLFETSEDQDGQHEFRVEGLIRLYFGRHCLDERVFRQTYSTGQQTFYSGTILNPNFRVAHAFTNANLVGLGDLAFRISQLPSPSKAHFQRSVIWFRNAAISTGVDSFIKMWVAMEMLFTNSKNMVRELAQKISTAYGISEIQAREKFLVRRLVELRNRIFHNGQIGGFQDLVVDTLSFLYLDLLVHQIYGEKTKYAEQFLEYRQLTMEEILK